MRRMHFLPAMTLGVAFAIAAVQVPAFAHWLDRPNAGYCPLGTCNRFGGWRTSNVHHCSAAHCGRGWNQSQAAAFPSR